MSILYRLFSPNYVDKVKPELFEELPELIEKEFYRGQYSREICDIVCAHKILTSNADYTRTRGPRAVANMLNDMTGDCEDQSVLLCSMYEALGLNSAIMVLRNHAGEGHLSTLVEVPGDEDQKTDELRLYYHDVFDEYHETISIEYLKGRTWFISGSTMTSYVGDISGLEREGYVERISESEWKWTEKKFVKVV